MPTISTGNLTKLRSEDQFSQFYMTIAKPNAVWSAQSVGSIARGTTAIPFDTGSGATFSYIQAEMEVFVGSAAGSDDIGRLRVKSITSGDGGVSGTLTVAQNALYIPDNSHITFLLSFPYKPKYSLLGPPVGNPIFYKDTNITYTDENTNLHPIIIAGSNRSNFLNTTWQINPHLEDSYTLDGSTITSYSATSLSLDGTPTISITAGTGVGTITFNAVGQYWIKYTVVSDNGQTQNSFRFYYVHSTDPTSEHFPFIDFEVKQIQGDWGNGGWTAPFTTSDNSNLTEIPDKTIAILWARNYYQSVEENITFLPDSSNVLISGYLQKEKISQDTSMGIGEVAFEIVTIQQLMKERYTFSLSLESKQSAVNDWYKFDSLTVPKALHHLFKWNSNLLEVCDVFFSDNTTPRPFVIMEAGSLYDLADNIAYQAGIRYHLVCDQSGRLHLTPDIQLLRDSERAVLDTVQEVLPLDKSGKVTISRNPVKSVILTKVSGFAWDGSFTTDCAQPLTSPCPVVQALCSSAPTIRPEDEGATISSHDQQTFEDQTHANELSGRFHAQSNNLYPELNINFSGNYSGVLDITLDEFWTINIATSDTIREFVWVDQNLIIRNVTLQINQGTGTIKPTVVFEPEVQGLPGVTTTCLGDWSFDFDFPEFPDFEFPDLTSPGALITGSDTNSVYYKGATGGDWVLRTSEDTLDLIQDPFWPIKNSSFEPRDSILLRCGVGFVKMSTDTFITETDITPTSNPPNDAGDSPAPTVADVEFFMLDANWITEDYFAVGIRWETGGEWRSWIAVTDDFGVTWTYKSILGYEEATLSTSTQFLFGSGGVLVFTPNLTTAADVGLVRLDATNDYYAATTRQSSVKHGHLISRTGETLTEDSDVAGAGATNRYDNSICRLTDTLFLTANRVITPLSNLFVDRWTVSGTTVTYTGAFANSQTPQPSGIKICRISDTTAFLAWTSGNPGTVLKGAIIDASTAVPTIGTVQTIYTGSGNVYIHGLQPTATGEIILLFSDGSNVKSIILTTSPFSTGTAVTIEAGAGNVIIDGITPIARINTVASPDILLTYAQGANYVRGCIINHTGTLINSASTPVTIVNSTGINSIAAALNNETEGAVFYRVGSTNGIASFTISGTTITPIANSTGFGSLGEVSNGDLSLAWSGEDRYFVAAWSGNSLRGVATVVYPEVSGGGGWSPIAENNVKLLGISIDKGTGTKLYATVWYPDEIVSQTHDLATLTIDYQLSLGSATEVQLDSYSRVAFPYGIFGDQDTVVIFGNIGGNHIQYSNDGGETFTTEVNDWGTDYCSSYLWDGTNKVAIRTDGINSKIYAGSTLTLRGTIPMSHVNPHNMKSIAYSGQIYILSGVGQAIMVIGSTQPHTTYYDVTTNHGNVKVGFALEIL